MLKHSLQRLGSAVVVLIGAITLSFIVTRVIPGDPARVIAGAKADVATVERIRLELGLNDPLYKQYARYMRGLAHGDLGTSYATNERVSEAIWQRLPTTFALGLTSAAIWMAIAIPLGVLTAWKQGSVFDRAVLVLATVGISLPSFWIASYLQYKLAYKAGLFSVAGYRTFSDLLLPALVLTIIMGGYYARVVHSSMVEVLRKNYIRTAAANGVPQARILFVHALRNALVPVVTLFGVDLAGIMGGVAFIENVFALPGLGTLAIQSIANLDGPMILGTVIVSATLVVVANYVVDLSYLVLDPRMKG